MEAILKKDHTLECSDNLIGVCGENKSEYLIITVEDEALHDKRAYIEFKHSNGTELLTEKLEIVDGKVSYEMPNVVLVGGYLELQVILNDANNFVWKSVIRKLKVGKSLNVNGEIAKENPDFIVEAQALLDEVEETQEDAVKTLQEMKTTETTAKATLKNLETYDDDITKIKSDLINTNSNVQNNTTEINQVKAQFEDAMGFIEQHLTGVMAVRGTEEEPVVLTELPVGFYIISGYYKNTPSFSAKPIVNDKGENTPSVLVHITKKTMYTPPGTIFKLPYTALTVYGAVFTQDGIIVVDDNMENYNEAYDDFNPVDVTNIYKMGYMVSQVLLLDEIEGMSLTKDQIHVSVAYIPPMPTVDGEYKLIVSGGYPTWELI